MYKLLICLSAVVAVAVCAYSEDGHARKYSYNYDVKDYRSHDVKSQWETKDGNKVRGSYRLVQPDGAVRTVEYVADDRHGFNAIITQDKNGHRRVTKHGLIQKSTENQGNGRNNAYHAPKHGLGTRIYQ